MGCALKPIAFSVFLSVFMVPFVSLGQGAEGSAPEKDGSLGSIAVSAFTFQNTSGVAVVTLYNQEDTWQEIDKAFRKKVVNIKGNSIYLKFKDLPAGIYGVYVLHDENKNGKMDMKWLPYPRPGEGVGGSNNYTKGRPKWKHVKFKIAAGENKAIKIKLKYF